MQFSERSRVIGLWLLVGCLAVFVCALTWPSAHLAGEYVPVGNDSFYHARRILDTAADPASFYQFDRLTHAPEGTLLTWPWGYDYALGWLVRLGVMAGIATDPMAILVWIPVAAVVLSVALIMLIARRLSLSMWSTVLAGLCVALSPLTQALHGVGVVDHHFAEYIFVLATIAAGLKWFSRSEDARVAGVLGIVLGVAPAIHNGLFILQFPVVAMLLLQWLQGIRVPLRPILFFAGALLAATVAILVPSLPFRLGHFEFYTLSWFHLYVAVGTAATSVSLGVLLRTRRNIAVLAVAAAVFLAPLGQQILLGHSFLVGSLKRLDAISEMRSVRQMALGLGGPKYITTLYSSLIWLWPLTVCLCAYRAWTERTSGRLFFWLCALCGLTLLVMQFRLHYFGSFALFLPWLVLVEDAVKRWPERRKKIMLVSSLALLLTFVLPIRYFLAMPPPPGGDPSLGFLRAVLEDLRKACAEDPGIVLSDNDAGHFIRYYTQCAVIADNFLLTNQDAEKIEQIDYLTSLSATALPATAPYVRYLLLRPVNIGMTDNGYQYVSFSPKKAPLLEDLLLAPVETVPAPYVLIRQVNMRPAAANQAIPLVRLYKVTRPGEWTSSAAPATAPGARTDIPRQ